MVWTRTRGSRNYGTVARDTKKKSKMGFVVRPCAAERPRRPAKKKTSSENRSCIVTLLFFDPNKVFNAFLGCIENAFVRFSVPARMEPGHTGEQMTSDCVEYQFRIGKSPQIVEEPSGRENFVKDEGDGGAPMRGGRAAS